MILYFFFYINSCLVTRKKENTKKKNIYKVKKKKMHINIEESRLREEIDEQTILVTVLLSGFIVINMFIITYWLYLIFY
jgi:UDP-N-acetylmuramyl pentapeptide phosphotransferase/UDP-N-acetylglucosamine-1-phosphate transferase